MLDYADLLLHSQNVGAKVFLVGAKAFLERSDINAPFPSPPLPLPLWNKCISASVLHACNVVESSLGCTNP